MSQAAVKPTRVVVISDLHLGGSGRVMMSRPYRLVHFLHDLAGQLLSDERSELVIAGDFVDFLAIEPWSSWTSDTIQARKKLIATIDQGPFKEVFKALGSVVHAGWLVTILLGNHDLELALPGVQQTILDRLSARPHQVLFVTDGRPYRCGGLFVEHGNRYDGANSNDLERLRLIASAYSRGESYPVALRVSAGSQLVYDHVNLLKGRYPFLDLLQPQNELVALLLLAFEPALIWDWNRIAALLKAQRLDKETRDGQQPGKTYQIAASPLDQPDEELRALFGEPYERLLHPPQKVALGGLVRMYLDNRKDSLSEIFARGEHVPADRLRKIRAMFRRIVLVDDSDRLDGPTEQYGKAAARLIANVEDVEVVIMGHTHLARKISMGRGWYVNTGTWIDRIRVPNAVLQEDSDEALETFLKDLLDDKRPDCPPTYADVRLDHDGHITETALEKASS